LEDLDFTVYVCLLSPTFVNMEKKLREAKLSEGRIAELQFNCEEITSLRNKAK
jgi:hypothetical protein